MTAPLTCFDASMISASPMGSSALSAAGSRESRATADAISGGSVGSGGARAVAQHADADLVAQADADDVEPVAVGRRGHQACRRPFDAARARVFGLEVHAPHVGRPLCAVPPGAAFAFARTVLAVRIDSLARHDLAAGDGHDVDGRRARRRNHAHLLRLRIQIDEARRRGRPASEPRLPSRIGVVTELRPRAPARRLPRACAADACGRW